MAVSGTVRVELRRRKKWVGDRDWMPDRLMVPHGHMGPSGMQSGPQNQFVRLRSYRYCFQQGLSRTLPYKEYAKECILMHWTEQAAAPCGVNTILDSIHFQILYRLPLNGCNPHLSQTPLVLNLLNTFQMLGTSFTSPTIMGMRC